MPTKAKKNIQSLSADFCEGFECDWSWTKSGFSCNGGGGGCALAILAEAEESIFHPKELVEATKKINRILARIPQDSKRRKLSFCNTRMGTLLAWCSHSGKPRGKYVVTRHDSDETVIRALKLKVKK